MLRKLIKHEFRATGRMMWPVFAAMLALTLAVRVATPVLARSDHWFPSMITGMLILGFGFGFMALSLAPLVVSAVRFCDHVLREEGYLTLTLPVSMHQLLASKLIVSAVWYAAAALTMVLLVFLLAFTDVSDWLVIPNLFTEAIHLLGKLDASTRAQAILFVVEFFLNCVLGVTAVSLIVYAAYAVGYSFHKHKGALTAVFMLVFFQLVQFAAVAVLTGLFDDSFSAWSSLTGVQAGNALLAAALAGETAVCAVFYFITWFFTTKKLDLE